MQKNTLLSIIIGGVIIVGAFLTVFGSSLKNLKQDPATATPGVTGNIPIKPSGSGSDKDDNTYDSDDYTGSSTTPVATPAPTPTPKPTPKPSGYTLADVKTHNSATSCWSAINGNVYDLTNWVNSHPGSRAAILMICGKDGSPLFNSQHGGSGRVAGILDRFKIGALN